MAIRRPDVDGYTAWRLCDLKPRDDRPAYRRIADAIRESLQAGAFRQGDQLPATNVIGRRYGVGQETVQRALRLLAEDGWVRVIKPTGTFVCKTREG